MGVILVLECIFCSSLAYDALPFFFQENSQVSEDLLYLCNDQLTFYDANSSAVLYKGQYSQFPLLLTSYNEIEAELTSCIRESPQRPLGFIGKVTYQSKCKQFKANVAITLDCHLIKGTLPRKSTWALNVDFSMKVTMVPFIWL